MKKIKTILKSWWKMIKGETTKLSIQRMKICKECDERIGAICGKCGCILEAKVLDDEEKCPLNKW